MEKILFVATVDEHIRHFHYPYLEWLQKQGYEVHVASRGEEELSFVDIKHNIPFDKSPFSLLNIRAYRQLKALIKANNYRLIHCHTPVGGVLGRLAGIRERKKGLKVVYTAHGFHFYKGAPIKNWLLYYPLEKILSRFTDTLILINQEDYHLALDKNFKAETIEYVKGVGVDIARFAPQTLEEKETLREKHSYSAADFILICVGELRHRKNQKILIKAVETMKDDIPPLKLLLVGEGDLYPKYKELIRNLGLEENVELLGYRRDVEELLLLSDVAVSSALQEGLPVSLMEAMAVGLPLVVSNCRGNSDLVLEGENGFIFDIDNITRFREKIIELYINKKLSNNFGEKSRAMIHEYSLDEILPRMEEIYLRVLE